MEAFTKFKNFLRLCKNDVTEEINVLKEILCSLDKLLNMNFEIEAILQIEGLASASKVLGINANSYSDKTTFINDLHNSIEKKLKNDTEALRNVNFLIRAFNSTQAVSYINDFNLLIALLLKAKIENVLMPEEVLQILGSAFHFTGKQKKADTYIQKIARFFDVNGQFVNGGNLAELFIILKGFKFSNDDPLCEGMVAIYQKELETCIEYAILSYKTYLDSQTKKNNLSDDNDVEVKEHKSNSCSSKDAGKRIKKEHEKVSTDNLTSGFLSPAEEYLISIVSKNIDLIWPRFDLRNREIKGILTDIEDLRQMYINYTDKSDILELKEICMQSLRECINMYISNELSLPIFNMVYLNDQYGINYLTQDLEKLGMKEQKKALELIKQIQDGTKDFSSKISYNKNISVLKAGDIHVFGVKINDNIFVVIGVANNLNPEFMPLRYEENRSVIKSISEYLKTDEETILSFHGLISQKLNRVKDKNGIN